MQLLMKCASANRVFLNIESNNKEGAALKVERYLMERRTHQVIVTLYSNNADLENTVQKVGREFIFSRGG